MTKHDKIEHPLPNGDVIVHDATHIRPEVDEAFRKVREDLQRGARKTYAELREAASA